MTIEWPKWRIRSNEFGFVVERKINPTRWKVETYHNSLAQATQSLFEYRVRTETANYVVNAMDAASARISTARLIKKVDLIAAEIWNGVSHAD